jgi:hypothetical protein
MLFSIDGPVMILAASRRQTLFQLVPEGVVRPVLDRVVERHLNVIAAQHLRAQRAQRKAALALGIDEFGRHRLGARQHAEPTERIDALVFAQHVLRNRLAADAVEAVGADDVIAIDADDAVALAIGDMGRVRLEVVNLHVVDIVDDLAAHLRAGVVEVARQFRLAVDDNGIAAGIFVQIDAVHARRRGR